MAETSLQQEAVRDRKQSVTGSHCWKKTGFNGNGMVKVIRNTFGKEEKLCGELRIAALFRQGQSAIAYPIRACWQLIPATQLIPSTEVQPAAETQSAVKVLISAPKKKLHRANKRNRAKRLMREAYRLQKHALTEVVTAAGGQLQVAFVWLADDTSTQAVVMEKMKKLLDKIQAAVEKK